MIATHKIAPPLHLCCWWTFVHNVEESSFTICHDQGVGIPLGSTHQGLCVGRFPNHCAKSHDNNNNDPPTIRDFIRHHPHVPLVALELSQKAFQQTTQTNKTKTDNTGNKTPLVLPPQLKSTNPQDTASILHGENRSDAHLETLNGKKGNMQLEETE